MRRGAWCVAGIGRKRLFPNAILDADRSRLSPSLLPRTLGRHFARAVFHTMSDMICLDSLIRKMGYFLIFNKPPDSESEQSALVGRVLLFLITVPPTRIMKTAYYTIRTCDVPLPLIVTLLMRQCK